MGMTCLLLRGVSRRATPCELVFGILLRGRWTTGRSSGRRRASGSWCGSCAPASLPCWPSRFGACAAAALGQQEGHSSDFGVVLRRRSGFCLPDCCLTERLQTNGRGTETEMRLRVRRGSKRRRPGELWMILIMSPQINIVLYRSAGTPAQTLRHRLSSTPATSCWPPTAFEDG